MRIRFALGMLAAAVVVACRSTTAPPAFAGQYRLAALNGAPVPSQLSTGIEIQSGWLRIDAGGDWMLARTQRAYAIPGTSVDTLSGRWSATGNDITLYFANTSVVDAVATYAAPGIVVVYAAQTYSFAPN